MAAKKKKAKNKQSPAKVKLTPFLRKKQEEEKELRQAAKRLEELKAQKRNYSSDYQIGYDDGYRAGYQNAKRTFNEPSVSTSLKYLKREDNETKDDYMKRAAVAILPHLKQKKVLTPNEVKEWTVVNGWFSKKLESQTWTKLKNCLKEQKTVKVNENGAKTTFAHKS